MTPSRRPGSSDRPFTHSSHLHVRTEPGDKRSAVIGMIVTAVALFVVAFTIVELTNMKYSGESAHAEAGK